VNHASGAVAPPDAEVVQVGDVIWQWAELRIHRVRGGIARRPARQVIEAKVVFFAVPLGDHPVVAVVGPGLVPRPGHMVDGGP
jgi:hypothetical protein